MKTTTRTHTAFIPLGLTIEGAEDFEKFIKIQHLTAYHVDVVLQCSRIGQGLILEISDRHPIAVRKTALAFARGVLATLES
jgi:hypothetical protein